MSALGMEIGGAIILPLVAGWYADRKFGTAPALALIGLVLGTIAALMAVLKALKASQDEERRERDGGDQ
jgi:F0F1-type ATP synthase assembly protein I